jgi:hypothetical protein
MTRNIGGIVSQVREVDWLEFSNFWRAMGTSRKILIDFVNSKVIYQGKLRFLQNNFEDRQPSTVNRQPSIVNRQRSTIDR